MNGKSQGGNPIQTLFRGILARSAFESARQDI